MELLEQERIYLVKRRHILVLRLQIFPLILLLLAIIFFIFFLLFKKITWPETFIQEFPQLQTIKLKFLIVFLLSLTLPVLWVLIFYFVTQYFLTYWIVTNQRLISSRFFGLFNISYETVSLDKIQDLTVFIKGILPSLYHYGTLRVETAGEKGQFLLDQIEDPEIVKQVIFEAKMDLQKQSEKL